MVTLESRWKTKRKWNTKLYVLLTVGGAACLALVWVACSLPAWLARVAALATTPPPNVNAAPTALVAPLPGNTLVEQFEREVTFCGYTLVLPNEFHLDVLPQPGDIPRGGRFTGVRFRAPWADSAQLHLIVVDFPREKKDEVALPASRRACRQPSIACSFG